MNWICDVCGHSSKTNRRGCLTCGNMRWRPAAKKDIRELAGPIKRVAPKGLFLAKPGKQAPVQDPQAVECGSCHIVIYRAEGAFDMEAFRAARKKHYTTSPACETRK